MIADVITIVNQPTAFAMPELNPPSGPSALALIAGGLVMSIRVRSGPALWLRGKPCYTTRYRTQLPCPEDECARLLLFCCS